VLDARRQSLLAGADAHGVAAGDEFAPVSAGEKEGGWTAPIGRNCQEPGSASAVAASAAI
jgi:hypothetical protein